MASLTCLLNVPRAFGSQLNICLAGISLAATKGFDGVRCSAGMANVPFANTITAGGSFDTPSALNGLDFAGITAAVNRASDVGLTKICFLINCGIRRSTALANAKNGGVVWPVPTLAWNSVTSTLRNYITDSIVQQIVDTAYNAAVAKGETPSTFLEFELLNEPGLDGNQEPLDVQFISDNTTGTRSLTTYAGELTANGIIAQDFASMLDLYYTRVNFRGCPTVCVNLEGAQGSDQVAEINSITGATWSSVITQSTRIGTNCYSAVVDAPYVAATATGNYGTKAGTQIALMTANGLIGNKHKRIGEYGIHRLRCPRCTHPNTIRQAITTDMRNLPSWATSDLKEAALYNAYNVGGSSSSTDFNFYAWEDGSVTGTTLNNAITVDGQTVDIIVPAAA